MSDLLPILATLVWFAIGVILGAALQANMQKREDRPVYVYQIWWWELDNVKDVDEERTFYILSHIPYQHQAYFDGFYIQQLSDEDAILYMRGLL